MVIIARVEEVAPNVKDKLPDGRDQIDNYDYRHHSVKPGLCGQPIKHDSTPRHHSVTIMNDPLLMLHNAFNEYRRKTCLFLGLGGTFDSLASN